MITRPCQHCSKSFKSYDAKQVFCSRDCANKGRRRDRTTATGKLCECGSGLPQRRTTMLHSAYFGLCCDACKVLPKPEEGKPVSRPAGDDQDNRNAIARRRLEELRDMKRIQEAGG